MGSKAAEHLQLAILAERGLEARVAEARNAIAAELGVLEEAARDLRAMLDAHPEAVRYLAGRLCATTLAVDRAAIELRANLEALAAVSGGAVPGAAAGAIAQA